MKSRFILLTFIAFQSFNVVAQINSNDVIVPNGTYDMGDHFGFVDPNHPSDETPIHSVKVDSFIIAKFETTNQQYLSFLQSSNSAGNLTVSNNKVYLVGDTAMLCYTNQYENWYSIGYSNNSFSIVDFRANHPVVGVMWQGTIAYCNWLSIQNNLQPCYDLNTGACNFTNNGYRLPTEAEWEWAARGGHTNPYFNYMNGDTILVNQYNLPSSGDPYEIGSYPFTTPVGFYDGTLKQKTQFNWPGNATSYQTLNGANGFGIYDMQGNVWELINDWYSQNYYSQSPIDNPKGPTTGFIMPDGKPYRGMRGGNWYNGMTAGLVNDGHSRVSNRNPSYYRGPQDPNHPWYHIGFRVARKFQASTAIEQISLNLIQLKTYPNPFSNTVNIQFELSSNSVVSLDVYDILGNHLDNIVHNQFLLGIQSFEWAPKQLANDVYYLFLQINDQTFSQKLYFKN